MKTYVTDFFKKLARKENIPMIIYLVLNLILVFLGTTIAIGFIIMDTQLANNDAALFLISVPTSILLYGIGIVIALSPIGEWLLRRKHGCEEITDPATLERIHPLFDEVHTAAREINPDIAADVSLYICNDVIPNAFATGRKTICINSGLLNCTDEEIKGVLAHEFGHISNHDTDFTLVVNVANWIVAAYFAVVWVIIMAYKLMFKGVGMIVSIINGSIGTFIATLLGDAVATAAILVFIKLTSAVWTFIGNMLIKVSSRKNEFLADRFAKESGFGSGLSSFLNTLADAKHKRSFIEKIAAIGDSHPATSKRIDALN